MRHLQKWLSHHNLWPHFLLQNPFLLEKCECLQKTRAQSDKIWPRYNGFKFQEIHSQCFSFFRPVNEKRRKSAGFQDFFEFSSSTWSIITPLFYMWFNIDTGGHKYQCWVITRIQNPGWQRVNLNFLFQKYLFEKMTLPYFLWQNLFPFKEFIPKIITL